MIFEVEVHGKVAYPFKSHASMIQLVALFFKNVRSGCAASHVHSIVSEQARI